MKKVWEKDLDNFVTRVKVDEIIKGNMDLYTEEVFDLKLEKF